MVLRTYVRIFWQHNNNNISNINNINNIANTYNNNNSSLIQLQFMPASQLRKRWSTRVTVAASEVQENTFRDVNGQSNVYNIFNYSFTTHEAFTSVQLGFF